MMQNNDIGSLLHNVSMALDKDSEQVLQERFGIGLAQFRILLALMQNDGIKQSGVANNLLQSQASISRQVQILLDKKLIAVRRSTANRRDRLVFLTRKGSLIAERSIEALNEYHSPMFDHIGENQQQELAQIMQKIQEYLAR